MTVANRTVWIAANTSWYLFKFRRPLIERLQNAGFRVITLAPTDQYTSALLRLGVAHVELKLRNANVNPLYELNTIYQLIRILWRGRPVVLLTFTPKVNIYGGIAASLLSIPFAATVSGLGRAFIHGGWLAAAVGFLYRLSFRRAARVFFQNLDDFRLFEQFNLVRRLVARLIPGSGVDLEAFAPPVQRTVRQDVTFLLVARLLRDKGVGEYVKAARMVSRMRSGVRFQIVGFVDPQNPTSFSDSDIQSWTIDGAIQYLGSVEDVRPIYANADCVVLPSYREGCPRVLLEAASMALPIITTDVPGCRQVVEHGISGYLCRPRSAEDLAAHMCKMLDLAAEERRKMGECGRQKMVREFDERIVIEEYFRTVNEIGRS